ncbi:MAG: MFS transporter [Alphaproteobacteria bacterium]|nr:MFS transporter [Alphaproteobacteria bacterium]
MSHSTHEVAAETPQKPLWAGVISLAFGSFSFVTAEFLPASLLTPMAADIGVTVGAAGQAISATAIAAGIAALITAIVSRGIDRRIVIWTLSVSLIVSSILTATAESLPALLIARVLLGIGLGGFWSMAAAIAMRLVPAESLPRAISLVLMGVSVATVSAAPVGAYLGALIGWRAVFLLASFVGVVALAVQLLSLPRLPARGAPDLGTLIVLARKPAIALVLIGVVVTISGHFAGFTYIRPFLETMPRLSVESISLVLLAFGLGGFVGNLVGGAITARSAKSAVVFGAAIVAAMGGTLLLFGTSGIVAGVAVGLWGFAFGALPVGFQTWMVRVAPPDLAESAGGILVAAFQVAITGGAVFGGLLVDGFGTPGVVAYMTIATSLGALGVILAGRRSPERIEATAEAAAVV